MSLISTASSGRERLTRAGAMSGEVAQVARPTAVDVLLQQFGWQSAVVEQAMAGCVDVKWPRSPARQHQGKPTRRRRGGIEAHRLAANSGDARLFRGQSAQERCLAKTRRVVTWSVRPLWMASTR